MSVAFTIRRCGIISALQPFKILFIALKLGLRFSFVFPEVKLCDTVYALKQTFGINNIGGLQATLERAGINLLYLRVNVKSRKRRYSIFPLFAKRQIRCSYIFSFKISTSDSVTDKIKSVILHFLLPFG